MQGVLTAASQTFPLEPDGKRCPCCAGHWGSAPAGALAQPRAVLLLSNPQTKTSLIRSWLTGELLSDIFCGFYITLQLLLLLGLIQNFCVLNENIVFIYLFLVLPPFEQGKPVCTLIKMENVFKWKPNLEIFNLLCCWVVSNWKGVYSRNLSSATTTQLAVGEMVPLKGMELLLGV